MLIHNGHPLEGTTLQSEELRNWARQKKVFQLFKNKIKEWYSPNPVFHKSRTIEFVIFMDGKFLGKISGTYELYLDLSVLSHISSIKICFI